MASLNVLVTAASRRVPLIRAFQDALKSSVTRGRVVVTDVNPLSPAVHAAERWYHVPLATAPDYLDAISGICEREHVGLIIPTIDDELEVFGGAAADFESRGIRIAVSPKPTSHICNDKLLTCQHLRANGIPAAETYLPEDLPASRRFPLFIKPRWGRGGVGAHAIYAPKDLNFFVEYVEDPVVQEYLDGPEFTIDVLCDFRHRPISIVPRERVVVRAGVIDRGRTVHDRRLIELAKSVTQALPFAGAVNIQCRVVDGQPTVFEINPRFSGGIPLTIAAGADFPRYLVELALGRPVPARIGQFRDQLWMTSYEASIFVEAEELETGRKPPVAIKVVA
ncbi:MAG TPA: ATP-grasp domain-containing protein [Vicinamibacterales bacterium]